MSDNAQRVQAREQFAYRGGGDASDDALLLTAVGVGSSGTFLTILRDLLVSDRFALLPPIAVVPAVVGQFLRHCVFLVAAYVVEQLAVQKDRAKIQCNKTRAH